MAFCPKCGNELQEGAKFCASCGHNVEGATNPETKETINTEEIKEAATEALEKGKEVAGEALEKGKEVAGEALEKGKEVAGEAFEKGKELVGNVAEAAKNVDVNEILDQAKTGNKKVLGIIAALVVVAVVIICVIFGSLFGGNYMEPIKAYMKAINAKDTDYMNVNTAFMGDKASEKSKKITQLFVEYDAELWDDYTYEDMLEDNNESLEDFYDDMDDEYDKWTLSFEEKDAEKMDKDDLEDFADDLDDYYKDAVDDLEDTLDDEDDIEDFADSYNIDEDEAKKLLQAQLDYRKMFVDCKVQAGYEVKGKFIIEADGDTYETDNVKLYMIKINGSWIYAGSDDYIEFEDEDDVSFYQIENHLNSGGFSEILY